MPERVLITGARAPAALDLARSFAASGFEAHMADCAPCWMSRASRSVAKMHRYPSPRRDPQGFATAVTSLNARLEPAVIIPACEEVFHLARIGALARKLFAPPHSTLARLHAKSRFAADCRSLGLPAPEAHRIESREALAPFLSRSTELVFKPDYSRFGVHTLVGPPPEAASKLNPTPTSPWAVQYLIRGEEASFYAAGRDSRLVAFAAYRSPWRLGGGASYAFAPLEGEPATKLRAMARTLAEKLVPLGQFACDAIIDPQGQPWLIECNPRATSGVHLFGRSPDLALAMTGLGAPVDAGDKNHRHVGPALWWYGLPRAMTTGRMEEWGMQRRRGQDVISAPGDRAPVVGALADTMVFGVRALFGGRTLAQDMTADIEWNGEEA